MKFEFSKIPKYCINLKRNSARRDTVAAEFKRVGLQVTFFEAIDKRDVTVPEISAKRHSTEAAGVLACAMSHIALIRHAKNNKLPAIAVFEDDVVFCDDFAERIKYIESLELDFEIFSLGGHFSNREIKPEAAALTEYPHIYRTFQHGGTYALVFTEATYDFILRNWNYNMGADEFYGNHVYRHFKSLAMVPFLVSCKPCESDITGVYWEYDNIKWHYSKIMKQNDLTLEKMNNVPRRYLKEATFIIPVRIESPDREFNFLRVIQYLCNNLDTNIIIYESDYDSKVLHLLKRIDRKSCVIEHLFERTDSHIFHRTRLLNEMITKVKTPITVNYDIDVLLPVEAYFHAKDRILIGKCDLVYPFNQGTEQRQIVFPNKADYNGENLMADEYTKPWGSLAGHVQFFKTESYINGGMENEDFISYGAEDRERMNRFLRMGYKVEWSPFMVYHIEHSRSLNSSPENPWFSHNEGLYHRLDNMEQEQIKEYYQNAAYYKKYGKSEDLFPHLR